MSTGTQRIMATPQNQPLAEISDDDLAALLENDPYVKVRGSLMTIETQPEVLPDAPENCPECGESYEKRTFRALGAARYIHHESGFGAEWCEVESDWQPQRTVTVQYERAKRVSQ